MISSKRFHLSRLTTKILHNDKVILGNSRTGEWVKLSEECYDILQYGVNEKLTMNELLFKLVDDEDRNYFSKFLKNLNKANILIPNDVVEVEDKRTFLFELTNRCNLACKHCSFNVEYILEKDYLDTDAIKTILSKLISTNPKAILLTGGEPMYRNDFFEILDFLYDNFNGGVGLMTNGTLINSENVEQLCSRISTLDISLDGVNEETSSIIRGEGVFTKAISAVKLCKEHGMKKISLSMVDTLVTSPHIPRFYELNKNLGTIPIVRAFSPEGRGKKNVSMFRDSLSTSFLEKFNKIIAKKECKESSEKLFVRKCGACTRYLTVDYRGYVYPCPLLTGNEFCLCDLKALSMERFKQFALSGYLSTSAYDVYKDILPKNVKNAV